VKVDDKLNETGERRNNNLKSVIFHSRFGFCGLDGRMGSFLKLLSGFRVFRKVCIWMDI
jgi:hypothetical protein